MNSGIFRLSIVLATLASIHFTTAVPASPGMHVYRRDGDAPSSGDPITYSPQNMEVANITWVGYVFPNNTTNPITLTGDIESIYNQILALNPNFAAANFSYDGRSDLRDPIEGASPYDDAPSGRFSNQTSDDGPGVMNCDCPHVSATTWDWCDSARHYLNTLGNGFGKCTIAAKSCSNIYCSFGCRVTVCNDWDFPFNTSCRGLVDDMTQIRDACPDERDVWPGATGWFKGVLNWPHHETHVGLC